MLVRYWWLLLSLIVACSVARVAMTHRTFSQVFDEPWHVAAGYEVLTKGAFDYDLEHPPLARVVAALPFAFHPAPEATAPIPRGNELLLQNGAYGRDLARARVGNLFFLALGIAGVALWGRHLFTPAVGLLAALLYALLPPVLAHAGFATTDMAVAAALPLALHALTLVLDKPSWRGSAYLGVALAMGLLSKFSFALYFPAAALVLVFARRRFPVRCLLAAAGLAALIVWATYGFSFSTLAAVDPHAATMSQEVFGTPAPATALPVPAPEYMAGLLSLKHHDLGGHAAFLLGETRTHGWWYYFPVTLFFKTPIPFLVLALAGSLFALRRRPEIALIPAALLAVAMTSHINIGVRHVLPIYAPLALAAALAVAAWPRLRVAGAALVLWLATGSFAAHPDYLPWFNAFARQPEQFLSDSNLDWGQDVQRLAETTQRRGIERLTVLLFTSAPRDDLGLPALDGLRLDQPVSGAFAISETCVAIGRARSPEFRAWFDEHAEDRPYERIGQSIRLYQFQDSPPAPSVQLDRQSTQAAVLEALDGEARRARSSTGYDD